MLVILQELFPETVRKKDLHYYEGKHNEHYTGDEGKVTMQHKPNCLMSLDTSLNDAYWCIVFMYCITNNMGSQQTSVVAACSSTNGYPAFQDATAHEHPPDHEEPAIYAPHHEAPATGVHIY